MIFVINMIDVIHVISMIVHCRRGVSRRRHRFADCTHDEFLGRSRKYPEVIILQVQLRVHENGQSIGEDPQVAVPINLSK